MGRLLGPQQVLVKWDIRSPQVCASVGYLSNPDQKRNLNEIAKSYKFAIEMATFDPQKVGKNISAYDVAEGAAR